jgi:hypothetical protein
LRTLFFAEKEKKKQQSFYKAINKIHQNIKNYYIEGSIEVFKHPLERFVEKK